MVAAHEIDFGLVTSPVEIAGLTTVPVVSEDVTLVRRSSPVVISVDDLRQLPMIVFSRTSGFGEFLQKALVAQGVDLRVKMEIDSVEAIKEFVIAGLGASFLPGRAVEVEIANGTLVKVEVDGLSTLRRQTSAVYRTSGHRNAAVRGFLDVLTRGSQ